MPTYAIASILFKLWYYQLFANENQTERLEELAQCCLAGIHCVLRTIQSSLDGVHGIQNGRKPLLRKQCLLLMRRSPPTEG
jgi:hypothetical protein